jgi:glutamate-1-semialdehyde 2,1-aminomutase
VYDTPGVTCGTADDVLVLPPNDISAVARAVEECDPAAVVIEATGSHWGTVPIDVPFLRQLRELTAKRGVLLVMDEVISGFRVHPGGVQGDVRVTPDLTTLAKILAGGLPGGCLAGRADLMEALAFDNRYGRPLSAAAGIAALEIVAGGEPCRRANDFARELRLRLNSLFSEKGADWVAYGLYSLTKILPNYSGPAPDGDDFRPYANDFWKLEAERDRKLSHAFRQALLLGGVDWMGWGGMTSAAHGEDDLERTVTAFDGAIDRLRADGLIR